MNTLTITLHTRRSSLQRTCKLFDYRLYIKVQCRALQFVFQDFIAARTKLCWRERGCHRQEGYREEIIVVEVFKSMHHLSPKFMWGMFQPKSTPYELRAKNTLQIPPSRTVQYGQRTLSAHEAVLWNSLPNRTRACNDLNTFKTLLERRN